MTAMLKGEAMPIKERKTKLSNGAPRRLETRIRCEKGRFVNVYNAQSASSPMANAQALAMASEGEAIHQLIAQPASMAHKT